MAKFMVDTEKTADYIKQLEILRENNHPAGTKPERDSCCGKFYDELETLCERMAEVREGFGMLLDKTICFLTAADEMFDASDRAEAGSITK